MVSTAAAVNTGYVRSCRTVAKIAAYRLNQKPACVEALLFPLLHRAHLPNGGVAAREDTLREHPYYLEAENIAEALSYAAWRQRRSKFRCAAREAACRHDRRARRRLLRNNSYGEVSPHGSKINVAQSFFRCCDDE